jgi:hypothetical protein
MNIGDKVIMDKPVSLADKPFKDRTGVIVGLAKTGQGPLVRVRLDDVTGLEGLLALPRTPEALFEEDSLSVVEHVRKGEAA